MAAPLALAAAAAGLPWRRDGRVHRNAFALARAADRAGLVSSGPRRVLVIAVYLLPLLGTLCFVAAVTFRRRTAGMLACVSGVVGLASAAVTIRAARGVRQPGPAVTIVLASLAVVAGARLLLERTSDV